MTVPWEEVKGTQRMKTEIRICSVFAQAENKNPAQTSHIDDGPVHCTVKCRTFSEAVASLVPLASKARAANGLS